MPKDMHLGVGLTMDACLGFMTEQNWSFTQWEQITLIVPPATFL